MKLIEILETFVSQSLKEALESPDQIFKGWLDVARIAKIEESYKELLSTPEGQLEIIQRASQGDEDAVLYLYHSYLPLTMKAFHKYYIGPDKELGWSGTKAIDGASELAAIAITLLSGHGDPDIYRVCNAEELKDSTNPLKQFSYYYYRYMQNECVKLYKREAKQGLGGNLEKDVKVSVESYDNYLDHSEETADSSASTAAERSDYQIIFKEFEQSLQATEGKFYKDVFHLRAKNYSWEDIAEELNVSERDVKKAWSKIRTLFAEKYPDLNTSK